MVATFSRMPTIVATPNKPSHTSRSRLALSALSSAKVSIACFWPERVTGWPALNFLASRTSPRLIP